MPYMDPMGFGSIGKRQPQISFYTATAAEENQLWLRKLKLQQAW